MTDDRLRRLMRHIALGLPFAIPVVTAPFNVGGCYPIGYQCPTVPHEVVMRVEAPPEGELDCEALCGDGDWTSCERADGGILCHGEHVECPPAGRRTIGLALAASSERDPAGRCLGRAAARCLGRAATRWLARAAALEAASVVEFEALAADLEALGAPLELVERARASAEDEVRHARAVGALAAARGAAPVRFDAPTATRRTARELALHNAEEGCVREVFGAIEARVMSETAEAADVRRAMAEIARDEARHALLSLDLDAWLAPRLSPDERRAVEARKRDAWAELAGVTRRREAIPELGLWPVAS